MERASTHPAPLFVSRFLLLLGSSDHRVSPVGRAAGSARGRRLLAREDPVMAESSLPLWVPASIACDTPPAAPAVPATPAAGTKARCSTGDHQLTVVRRRNPVYIKIASAWCQKIAKEIEKVSESQPRREQGAWTKRWRGVGRAWDIKPAKHPQVESTETMDFQISRSQLVVNAMHR